MRSAADEPEAARRQQSPSLQPASQGPQLVSAEMAAFAIAGPGSRRCVPPGETSKVVTLADGAHQLAVKLEYCYSLAMTDDDAKDGAGRRYGARRKEPGGLTCGFYLRVSEGLLDHLHMVRDRVAKETDNPKLAVADIVREALWKIQ
jgi:hypothetical protein